MDRGELLSLMKVFEVLLQAPSFVGLHPPSFTADQMRTICQAAIDTLDNEPTLLEIDEPVVIVGDIHGSLEDLLMLIKKFGRNTKYLFLGDYVDRGENSIPVITFLLLSLALDPTSYYLIRGNHEFSHINRVYGFYDEIISGGDTDEVWEMFQDVFSYLPLAAIISNSIFCVHGGLSPRLTSIQELRELQRPIQNYLNLPLVSDLVWSDPSDSIQEYAPNQRGSGVLFGSSAVSRFLQENSLQLLIRAHQCTTNGVHAFAGTMGVTVFSCSNYSGIDDNRCGAIRIESNKMEIYSLTRNSTGCKEDKINMALRPGVIGMFPEAQTHKSNLQKPSKPPPLAVPSVAAQPNSLSSKATPAKGQIPRAPISSAKTFTNSSPAKAATKPLERRARRKREASASGVPKMDSVLKRIAKAPHKASRKSASVEARGIAAPRVKRPTIVM